MPAEEVRMDAMPPAPGSRPGCPLRLCFPVWWPAAGFADGLAVVQGDADVAEGAHDGAASDQGGFERALIRHGGGGQAGTRKTGLSSVHRRRCSR